MKICNCYPFVEALCSTDSLLMKGILNRRTSLHIDRLDPLHSWATIVNFGKFTKISMIWFVMKILSINHFSVAFAGLTLLYSKCKDLPERHI